MDPLSEVLASLGLRSARCTRLEAGGRWALSFPAKPALKFAAVLRGQCWITLPGAPPRRLDAGDAFCLANAPGYVLANDPQKPPQDGVALFDWAHSDTAHHGGDDTVLVAGRFTFAADGTQDLLGVLPAFMHLPTTDPTAARLRGTLDLLDGEIRSGSMGASLVTHRLADILLVQALRAYAAGRGDGGAGWLGALADRRVGAALRLLHGDIARRWTVDALARAVGMSRSGFALRFRDLVGVAPLAYLTRWRMQCARDALRRTDCPVADLAARLGYASESAFGHAFKRTYGRAPKRYWSSAAAITDADRGYG